MKKNSAWALRLTVLSLATFVAQTVYADSQALRDLKIHIASVQQVLVDPKLADPQKRPQRRRLALTVLHHQDVEVETKTQLKDGSEYSVTYRLKFSPTGWRAYDIVVEGVSLVNNYRSQFDRFLSKKSFDELLQVLRDKKNNFSESPHDS